MMKFKTLWMAAAMIAATTFSANAATWSHNWNTSKNDGGEGFYNTTAPDTLSTTLKGWTWMITGAHKYMYSGAIGQSIGSVNAYAEHASLYTYDAPEAVTSVSIKARRQKDSEEAIMQVSVGGVKYLCEGENAVYLTTDSLLYTFVPEGEAQSGKLDIEFFQNKKQNILFVKSIAVEYKESTSTEVVAAPVLSLSAGTYDAAQICSISVPDYQEGSYAIYYTLDGTSPKGNGTLYTEPVQIESTATLKAVAKVGDSYSEIVEAKYVIRVSPEFKFEQDTMYIEAPDNGYSPYPNSKVYINDITFKSSDPSVCRVSDLGVLYSIKPGVCTISACFAGNDTYLPDTASYTLIVLQKAPLPKPVLSPMGGTFDAPVEVSVSVSGDERAMAIWYSMTAKDSAELTDEPTIIKATEGKITIKKSCKLLVLAAGVNVFSPLVEAEYIIDEKLSAQFGADEASTTYYKQGFDSSEEIADWKLYNTSSTTFRLMEEPTLRFNSSFSSIDPDNKYSLNIQYSDYEKQSEIFESPAMKIKPNSSVEFYSFFSGGMLWFANWYLSIYDETTGKEADLVNAFDWAQANGYTGPAWIRFNCDLSEYEDHELYFAFVYEGQYGEDAAFDGFKLMATDLSDSAKIVINEGESVHLHDYSVKATSVRWELPGGTIVNEDEHNPIVTYNEAGTYDVMLIVSDGEETDTLIRKDYIEVKAQMPKAIAGLPAEGYLSPFTATFIPVGVPVTFHDLSTGNPTDRTWTFVGTDISSSTEKDPVVTYTKAGTYSLALEVSNKVGKDQDILYYAIQAGGAQYIWNIAPEENQDLENVLINSYYGYYAGSNWLEIYKFAEKFHAPLAPATIDSVAIYFGSVTTVTPDTAITVEIQTVDANGMPGEVLASGSVKAGDLAWDDEEVVATTFILDKTANITGEFFVTVSGIPNNYKGWDQDNIAILCHRREEGERNSVFHYLTMYDEKTYDNLGEEWVENESPLSMAVAPVLSYGIPAAISNISSNTVKTEQIYNVNGLRVDNVKAGLYIIDGKKVMVK